MKTLRDDAIEKIKILDPACGSGAFPMGILHKLVLVLHKLDPENKYWYKLQYQKAIKETEEVFKVGDKQEREERLKEVNEAFDTSINDPNYARKLFLIRNCIYGVDIQEIAVQISKLRFFVSLLIDQQTDDNKPNRGIKALPNLETKFVAANTLIGLDRPQQLTIKDPDIEKLESELFKVREDIFYANSRWKKIELHNKISQLCQQLKKELLKSGFPNITAEQITSWDLFDQNTHTDWFDTEWMFGIKDGFDVVIANPPYGNLLKSHEKKSMDDKYSFSTLSDISSPFIERGFTLLKNQGNLIL